MLINGLDSIYTVQKEFSTVNTEKASRLKLQQFWRVITYGHYLGPVYNKAVYGLLLASIESYWMPILQRKGWIAIVPTKAALQP